MIFVFGSNLAGRHGKGAAKEAVERYGAVYGQGVGMQGNSYAIPTKDKNLQTLPLIDIKKYVNRFLLFAQKHPTMQFYVTAIGCGLANYEPSDIAPMFRSATKNVLLPPTFKDILRRPPKED